MSPGPSPSLWLTENIAGHSFYALNLDHPRIETRILSEIESGIDVYYDRRWDLTGRFCQWLIRTPRWVAGRSVLILGAGVGLETVLVGSLCAKLYINDLSPLALDLCAGQLRKNRIRGFKRLPGRYETLALPPVDLLLGCFLVYNRDTARAMQHLLSHPTPPVLLANEEMPDFQKLIRDTTRKTQDLPAPVGVRCVLFETAGRCIFT